MIQVFYIFRKCTKRTKLRKKLSHLMYMDDFNHFVNNKIRIGNSDINNIQHGYREDLSKEKCTTFIKKERKSTRTEGVELLIQERIRMLNEKKNTCTYEYWKLTLSNKRKRKENISETQSNMKISRNQAV